MDVKLNFERIGDAFQPSLGFVPRTGVNIAATSIRRWQRQPTQLD